VVAEKDDIEGGGLRIECPVLVTERLVLRPPHAEDVPDMARLAHNRHIAGMLARMPHPYGEAEARSFVGMAAEGRFGGCSYAVTIAETGAFVGCAGLHPKEPGLELGYWIGEPYWGRGYASEAAHALVDVAFRATDIDVLHVACRVVNAASRRVIRKCGFRYAGHGMMDSLAAGRVPVERYTLDRKAWIGLRLEHDHGMQRRSAV
jgi:RimJ/RimL family protein N-acetyltransferase